MFRASDGSTYDDDRRVLALCLMLHLMLITTRSVVAAAVIVGTVVSLGASFSGCGADLATSWVSSCTGWC